MVSNKGVPGWTLFPSTLYFAFDTLSLCPLCQPNPPFLSPIARTTKRKQTNKRLFVCKKVCMCDNDDDAFGLFLSALSTAVDWSGGSVYALELRMKGERHATNNNISLSLAQPDIHIIHTTHTIPHHCFCPIWPRLFSMSCLCTSNQFAQKKTKKQTEEQDPVGERKDDQYHLHMPLFLFALIYTHSPCLPFSPLRLSLYFSPCLSMDI